MSKKYRVGIIGFAHPHINHVASMFTAHPQVEMVACADTVVVRGRLVAVGERCVGARRIGVGLARGGARHQLVDADGNGERERTQQLRTVAVPREGPRTRIPASTSTNGSPT